ncbi:MAG: FTR1 family protein [Chloroflexota bacterium]
MIASYLLALREGLEASLVVGIALGVLRWLRRPELTRPLWLGVASASLISFILAVVLNQVGAKLEGAAEQAFEGLTMVLAAIVLTWMIFWMQAQGRQLRANLEADVQRAASGGQSWAVFSLAFLAVLREGVETALFLTAAGMQSDAFTAFVGGLLGLATAVLLGWALFAATIRLDLRKFFTLTGGLLLLFAAGLVAHGVHEFNELGWIPSLIEHVWDTGAVLEDSTGLGQVLRALFGYNANPSLTEVLAYVAYLGGILLALWRRRQPLPSPQQA